MEMERVFEFPHTHMDRRPRKRARLGWDVPEVPKVTSFLDPIFSDLIVFLVSLVVLSFLVVDLVGFV